MRGGGTSNGIRQMGLGSSTQLIGRTLSESSWDETSSSFQQGATKKIVMENLVEQHAL